MRTRRRLTSLYDFAIAPFADYAFMRRALVASMALGIGCAPVGVWLVASLYDPDARFTPLLLVLSAGATLIAAVALALPRDREALAT